MITNRQDRQENPSEDELRKLLFGRKIVSAEKMGGTYQNNYHEGTLTLDDGTVLYVGGNEGCGGCPSGYYWLAELNTVDNAITNVVVEERPTSDKCSVCDKWDCEEHNGWYRIFVVAEDQNQHLVASFEGSDGNGYYGTGYWISVVPT